jgi:dihydroneopterin aldolase
MDIILIHDLAVAYRVGVPDAERSQPQKLLLSLELGCDCSAAAQTDDLRKTIDYHAVCQRLLAFGEGRSWKLIETLAVDIAAMVRTEFQAASIVVTVKKFVIPGAAFVGVRVAR